MKKQLSIIFTMITLFSSAVFAQKTRFGIQAGPALSNTVSKFGDVQINSDWKPGFTGGLVVDIPISGHFIFQPALNFVQKGNKSKDGTDVTTTTLNYIEAPLNFIYRQHAASGFFAGIGPSIGYGISGVEKSNGEKSNLHFGNNEDKDDLKQMDFGGNLMAGYLFGNGIFIAANYNKSFSNLVIGDLGNDFKIRNNYFGLRVGYFFKGKSK